MKRAHYEAMRRLAFAAIDEALDASNDASYRVSDWPGPSQHRREAIKALYSRVLALDAIALPSIGTDQ